MWKLSSIFLSVLFAFSACAQQPPRAAAVDRAGSANATAPWDQASAEGGEAEGSDPEDLEERARRTLAPAPTQSQLPSASLEPEVLYKFLAAEIAAQRGEYKAAGQAYLELARSTRDPRLARRAAEVASYAKLPAMSLEAVRLWVEIEPNNPDARRALGRDLVDTSRLDEAKAYLQKLIAEQGDARQAFMQLYGVLAKQPDRQKVLSVVKELAAAYPQLPEAHFAVAQAAIAAGKKDAARQEIDEAQRLKPDWELAALFHAQLLQQDSPPAALEYLVAYLKSWPKAVEVRSTYARLLLGNKQLREARAQYETLLELIPANADLVVTLGLVSLQMSDFDAAEGYLKKALGMDYRDPDSVRFHLGQTAEERKQTDAAMQWYSQVTQGEQFVAAQARYGYLLGITGHPAEARTYLQAINTTSPEQRLLVTQTEAQLLRETKAYKDAFDVLEAALLQQPDSADLLYDAAMAAEKLDRLDTLEAHLRKLITLRPDHAQAYNALGYTLADRTDRLKEAHEYIDKALKLAPEDPFILDSMGWVNFRLGDLQEGLVFLQRAFAQRPDPEIAAHLGEVLWMKGDHAEAEKVWRDSAKQNPDNDLLKGTMGRLLR